MSGPADVVGRMITLAGHTLILAMEPLSDGEFFAENANGFSAAWVVGHAACFADLFSSWHDSGHLLLDAGFHRVFNDTSIAEPNPVSKAAGVDPARFPKALLLHRFREASVKALRVLRDFDPALWDAPAPPGVPVTLRTGGDVWERLAAHGYWHDGELAGSVPRFFGTYALNIEPHFLYVPG